MPGICCKIKVRFVLVVIKNINIWPGFFIICVLACIICSQQHTLPRCAALPFNSPRLIDIESDSFSHIKPVAAGIIKPVLVMSCAARRIRQRILIKQAADSVLAITIRPVGAV